jgi:hypothetical protein
MIKISLPSIILFLFSFSIKNSLAQEKVIDSQQAGFLKIKGTAREGKLKVSDAVARLYRGNVKVDSAYTDDNGSFSFSLAKDQGYTLEITQFGYEPSLIKINTFRKQVDKKNEKNKYNITIDAEMVPEISEKEGREEELDILDFPVADISYNTKEDAFVNNVKYTKYIKGEIKKIRSAKN